jgi:hypothetical protein
MTPALARHSGEGRNPVALLQARRMSVWIPAQGRDDGAVVRGGHREFRRARP